MKLHFSPEVAAAQQKGTAIVALESTIIAHGMPYPQNLETATALEDLVRKAGAVPATIAVLEGKICVGLSKDQLQMLATSEDVLKLSKRDFAFAVAQGKNGATTVATTMLVAEQAGIAVFATGGIGGVHRGASQNFDISADLIALGQTNVMVVCAGAKSILDLPKTLEYLETQGVPVIGYQTNSFPAFYAPDSGLALQMRFDTPKEAAHYWRTKQALKISGGCIVANPVPERAAMDAGKIEEAIQEALAQANAQGISGKALTPFLLAKIKSLTGGRSLEANVALVKNNVQLAAEISVAMQRFE